MYIRRKVFSVVEDVMGVERYFSTTEFMNEESYLEQREYADAEDALAGAGATGVGAAVLAAAGYGAHKGLPKAEAALAKRRNKRYEKLVEKETKNMPVLENARGNVKTSKEQLAKIEKQLGKNSEAYKAAAKSAKKFEDAYASQRQGIVDQMVKNGKLKKNEAGLVENLAKKAGIKTSQAAKLIKNNPKTAAAIAAGTVAAGAGVNMLRSKD